MVKRKLSKIECFINSNQTNIENICLSFERMRLAYQQSSYGQKKCYNIAGPILELETGEGLIMRWRRRRRISCPIKLQICAKLLENKEADYAQMNICRGK